MFWFLIFSVLKLKKVENFLKSVFLFLINNKNLSDNVILILKCLQATGADCNLENLQCYTKNQICVSNFSMHSKMFVGYNVLKSIYHVSYWLSVDDKSNLISDINQQKFLDNVMHLAKQYVCYLQEHLVAKWSLWLFIKEKHKFLRTI